MDPGSGAEIGVKGSFHCVGFRGEGCGTEPALSTKFLVGVRVPKVNFKFWGRIFVENNSRKGLEVK